MQHHTRALAVVPMALILVAGCSHAAREQRASESQLPPATAATSADVATPLVGHPPVSMRGVVAKFDTTSGVLLFQDGRRVQLTDQSQVLDSKTKQPVANTAIRPGDRVVVANALPLGVQTSSMKGKRQRMATVKSVDQSQHLVMLSDGSVVRVTPSTQMRMGNAGSTVVITDLQPGDELVIIVDESAPRTARATTATQTTVATGPPTSGSPSELPRNVVTGSPSDPTDAIELMVFREVPAP